MYKSQRDTVISLDAVALGKGGEGTVYKILTPHYTGKCAKILHESERTKYKLEKLQHMIANPPSNLVGGSFIICWPTELIFENGKFAGYVMPLAFSGSKKLNILFYYTIKHSDQWFEKFARSNKQGILNRLKLIKNIALTYDLIHATKKYVLVDIKPQNILITIEGKISIVDADSLQISTLGKVLFFGKVGTEEYRPPEGALINPAKNQIPESWDRFSVAVMFYELLFGIHPYAASYGGQYEKDTAIKDKIVRGLFPLGSKSNFVKVLPKPHNNLKMMPTSIQQLFFSAFEPSNNNPLNRPTVKAWADIVNIELNKNTQGK